jgi:hypothetical protein
VFLFGSFFSFFSFLSRTARDTFRYKYKSQCEADEADHNQADHNQELRKRFA